MASMTKPNQGAMAINTDDPFVSAPTHAHPRYATFDNQKFDMYSSSSPSQARRALESHLKDTDKRIQDASRLGTALLQQRKDLNARLKEVEQARDEGDMGPDLRKKLADLEKEYTDLGRESARAFLPRSRIDAAEPTMSPSVLSGDSRASPSKLSAPSRRQRNQPSGRVHDIEFAAEISTSLLAQVRQLQAVLVEKEDALNKTISEKEQLQTDVSSVRQRMRNMDDNEQRYKDENWNLETQLQEMMATTKESSDREQRLTTSLSAAQAERESTRREFEDLRQAHDKLTDDHALAKKQQESELHSLRRDISGHEDERDGLHKKIEDLTSQNTELAKAVAYRWNTNNQATNRDVNSDDDDFNAANATPEDSPPPSPTKATPRHGMLESETLKSSLTHAHRMIQNLKNNIHREKTEKIELKRMLQDARDELEARRGETGMSAAAIAAAKKRASQDNAKLKKPVRADQLGASRLSREEIIMDDEDWEDHDGQDGTPSRPAFGRTRTFGQESDSADAFETANEQQATSEAFHTGAESLDGESSGEQTETEGALNRSSTIRGRPSFGHIRGQSYMSTASASGDETGEVRTPVQAAQPRFKLRAGRQRGSSRQSELFESTVSNASNSPAASFISSNRSTPVAAGQNLGAELDGLSDEEDESQFDGTPSRASLDSARSSPKDSRVVSMTSARSTPEVARSRLVSGSTIGDAQIEAQKSHMVDSGMMTEPWVPVAAPPTSLFSAAAGAVGGVIAGVAGSAFGHHVEEDKGRHAVDQDTVAGAPEVAEEKPEAPADEPVVPTSASHDLPQPQTLASIVSQHTEPIAPTSTLQKALPLELSPVKTLETHPQEPNKPSVQLGFASFSASETHPIEPVQAIHQLGLSSVRSAETQPTEPVYAPVNMPVPAPLELSSLQMSATEPAEPVLHSSAAPPKPMPFALSPFKMSETHPSEPNTVERIISSYVPLTMSPITAQTLEPEGGSEQYNPPLNTTPHRDDEEQASVSRSLETAEAVPGTNAARPGAAFVAARGFITPEQSQQPFEVVQGAPFLSNGNDENAALDKSLVNDKTKDDKADTNIRVPLANVTTKVVQAPRTVSTDTFGPQPIYKFLKSEGTQTMVSSDEIDGLMKQKSKVPFFAIPTTAAVAGLGISESPPKPVANTSSPRKSTDTAVAPLDSRVQTPLRASGTGSLRKNTTAPPLPPDHSQKIAAAAQSAPPGAFPAPVASGSMGPPIMPASAYKPAQSLRSRTPSLTGHSQVSRSMTARSRAAAGRPMSPTGVPRHGSVSSFASEVDERFNPANPGFMYPADMEPATDPRMIQAITQTMIGEYLWKYTRKAGRSDISNTRHRRFFWVHPYTRTLYWSEQDPSTAGKQQLKAKSVAIEAVRVIPDDNAYPPGLHRKSLVVVTPGREIVFTAPTSQRHETWFNALSYLLLRTAPEREAGAAGADDDALNASDLEEFNPSFGRSASKSTAGHSRSRSRVSLSSYNSRTTRQSSPLRPGTVTQRPHVIEVPSLSQRQLSPVRPAAKTPTHQQADQTLRRSRSGRFGSFSGFLPGSIRGSFSSKRSRAAAADGRDVRHAHPSQQQPLQGPEAIYNASAASDSAEDLRAVIERQEHEAHRLENVRACCDGKHDVGSLSRDGRHTHGSLTHRHGHSHSHPIADPASVSSRFSGRN